MTPQRHPAQTGTSGAVMVLPAVVPVADGALDLIFDLVAEIKESDTYTEATGTDLRIIGPAETAPDFATLQPALTAKVSGGHVELGWDWQGYGKFLDMTELQVDRTGGTAFGILAFDTTPGYIDTTPFPATPTVWKYRAIYRVNDMQVGQWSATVSVTVGG